MANDFLEAIRNQTLLFDGAMGTELQKHGLSPGQAPERLNFTRPETVAAVHRAYREAGADAITANTFGANRLKLPGDLDVRETVEAAVRLAHSANPRFVALDVGPTGQLTEPFGTLKFEDAYDVFTEQVKAGQAAGADLILFETFSDLYELKAAVLAAKENTNLPVAALMTFQSDGRTFMGTDPRTAAVTLTGLGVDVLGINCSLGPKDLLAAAETMLESTPLPVMIQANAGLPAARNGKTVYDVGPEEYAACAEILLRKGVRILGGCCGTDPRYIAELRKTMDRIPSGGSRYVPFTAVSSATRTVVFDNRFTVIGERINPTGKKRLKQALREEDMDFLVSEALDQADAGAAVLDVNVGLPEIDEPAMLCRAVREIQSVTSLPLQLDSADPAALERAARRYNGKPLINSFSGKRESMEAVFPIVKKYGAAAIGLTLDENGIPETAQERLRIAERMVRTAAEYGIPKEDLIIDCLTLTASAGQDQIRETLKAIFLVRERLGVKTVLGVSNVSFGLPDRPRINAVFLAMAMGAGLDAAILNPLCEETRRVLQIGRVLTGEDRNAENYIRSAESAARADSSKEALPAEPGVENLREAILRGRADEAARLTAALRNEKSALDIIDGEFVPALNEAGARFESGKLFLPGLLQTAAAVQSAFEVLKSAATTEALPQKEKILLATVKGDVHDIGKNIVKMLLENYGYRVVDMGRDVAPEEIVRRVLDEEIALVGLSALMTTTLRSMRETVEALRAAGARCKVMVGGAVLTEEYARSVGADFYAKDAQSGVRYANELFGRAER